MRANKAIQWAAVLAISGCGLAGSAYGEDVKAKADRAVDGVKEGSADIKAAWEQGRIRTTLKQITEASLTKGGFDDLVERFNDADRNRIGEWIKNDANKAALEVLDGRIAQFQKDWKAKYNSDFEIEKDADVFIEPYFSIGTGEIGDDAQVAGEKVPAAENVTAENIGEEKDAAGNTTADKNLESGRNIGYVVVTGHDMPELKVPMVHELPDHWKIDVPDNVDGQVLYDNLLAHLTMANEHASQWPADVNDGYRLVSHHVLMAVIDVDHATAAGKAELGGEKSTEEPAPAKK